MQCFETEALMGQRRVVAPVLTYLFHRLEERFDGRPTLLVLEEAWIFLDPPVRRAHPRMLKTLRKKYVAVLFATQSLADIIDSNIAPAIIESCPQRILLPNDRAIEPQSRSAYERFGLNAANSGAARSSPPCSGLPRPHRLQWRWTSRPRQPRSPLALIAAFRQTISIQSQIAENVLAEKRFVQQLVAHAIVEALDEPMLCRLARRDITPLDTGVAGPGEHRFCRQLGPVAHWEAPAREPRRP